MKKRSPFDQVITLINGKVYRVDDYPSVELIKEKGPETFKKGFAYRYITQLQQRILPYLGIIDDLDEFEFDKEQVGIYYIRKEKKMIQRIVFPRTRKEAEAYSINNIRTVMSAVSDAYHKNQFADAIMSASDSGSFTFIPPMHADDDMLNKAVKYAIRLKEAPFEPYGKRLETLAVEKGHGMEGTNIKNNGKRGLRLNRAMSANKAMQYADTWQVNLAIMFTDMPNAMHPIAEDNQVYVYYPSGLPFEVDPKKLINIGPMIEEAIINDKNMEDESDE